MCGRFALSEPIEEIAAAFAAVPRPDCAALDHPRYSIRPTQQVIVIRAGEAGRQMLPMRWGFVPHWYKSLGDGPLLINARGESVHEKPAFKAACRERRCLIPADGFYEWQAVGAKGKQPYWIAPRAGGGMVFAGIWQAWQDLETVAIVTCAANEAMRPLHERLPVAIAQADAALWLGEEGHGAAALMHAPAEDFYDFHPVSAEIGKGGKAAPDHPGLRRPVDPPAGPPAPEIGPLL
ncbi:MAG: SOS response-associated peptidase [Neomegalonema sp.]|nr:SOS response-associated peptidase [Neomegalonema sp.]